jgi:hypothetical protein
MRAKLVLARSSPPHYWAERDFGDAKVCPAGCVAHTLLPLTLALPVIIATNAHTYILSLAFKLAHAFKFNQPWHAALPAVLYGKCKVIVFLCRSAGVCAPPL